MWPPEDLEWEVVKDIRMIRLDEYVMVERTMRERSTLDYIYNEKKERGKETERAVL